MPPQVVPLPFAQGERLPLALALEEGMACYMGRLIKLLLLFCFRQRVPHVWVFFALLVLSPVRDDGHQDFSRLCITAKWEANQGKQQMLVSEDLMQVRKGASLTNLVCLLATACAVAAQQFIVALKGFLVHPQVLFFHSFAVHLSHVAVVEKPIRLCNTDLVPCQLSSHLTLALLLHDLQQCLKLLRRADGLRKLM